MEFSRTTILKKRTRESRGMRRPTGSDKKEVEVEVGPTVRGVTENFIYLIAFSQI